MQKQTIEFATIHKNSIITRIGKTGINQPRANFKVGSVKWYEDRQKQTSK